MISGQCECKRVQYQIDGDVEEFSHCHCSQCRRLHGAAFASFAGIQRSDFTYLQGEEHLKSYASSASSQRVFCGTCGSNILVEIDSEPEHLYIAMGTVDGNPNLPEGFHIFVGSKAPWHEITDDLIQHDMWSSED